MSPLSLPLPVAAPATLLALLLALPGAQAAAPSAPTSPLSATDVAVLAATCANCHGPGGRAPAGNAIPGLRGHTASYLLQRLQSFQAGTASDATVMTRLMKGYDAAQIAALSQWFASKEGQ